MIKYILIFVGGFLAGTIFGSVILKLVWSWIGGV